MARGDGLPKAATISTNSTNRVSQYPLRRQAVERPCMGQLREYEVATRKIKVSG